MRHVRTFTLPDSKLLLLVRHGQAISNWLDDTLGPDEWFKMEGQCAYTDPNGTNYDIFDAGERQEGIKMRGSGTGSRQPFPPTCCFVTHTPCRAD